ncbi:putative tyrosine kinase-containing protein 3 [Homarus americanus]|uniref:Putative tyrosine kinase-containing protein 3 n=1 Tax=Homarus americanus TaxID=6706 RepID=A0A8J5JGC3_HOMAM|nr:putative tyrosine kinase-containing protein 3 [Homarus americanus]
MDKNHIVDNKGQEAQVSLVRVTTIPRKTSSTPTSSIPHTSSSSHNSSSSTTSSSGGRDLPQLTWDHLSLMGKVGTGRYGVSHHGQLTLDNGDVTEVVVKILHSGKDNTKEARVLHELAGTGGAPILYGVTTNPHAIVMQYCRGVTLSTILHHFSHLDLHAGNVIIDTSTSPYTCHLIDVGMSERIPPDDDWYEQTDWVALQDIQTRLHLHSPDDLGLLGLF